MTDTVGWFLQEALFSEVTVTLSTSIFSTTDGLVEYNPTADQGISDYVNREFLMLPF